MQHIKTTRRSIIKFIGLSGTAMAMGHLPSLNVSGMMSSRKSELEKIHLDDVPYKLPALPFAYDALEPHIDARTMEIHHSKHHAGYVNKLNDALAKYSDLKDKPLETLLRDIKKLPDEIRTAVRNNGGGHYNHTFFWLTLSPEKQEPTGKLADALIKHFGSVAEFKKQFSDSALKVFGSGWAWLVKNGSGLRIVTTPNQDNPVMDVAEEKGNPVLGIDVWEHAYYLKHQNKRAQYLEDYWNVVNWKKAGELFES